MNDVGRPAGARACWLTWPLAILAAGTAAVVLNAATGATVNQKVKSGAVARELFSENGYLWTFGWTCAVTGFVPQSPAPTISPASSDPRAVTPNTTVLTANTCWGALSGVQVGMRFFTQFNSLSDVGVWTVVCNGIHVDPARCTASNPPCTPTCANDAVFSNWANPFTWTINVFNSPPSVSVSHAPTPAWNNTVTLTASGSDPDGGALAFRWTVTSRPSASTTALANASSGSPTIQFTSDNDIGRWNFQLDVDDDEGERRMSSHTFDVPNVPPTISVANGGNIEALVDIAPVATVADPDGHTPSVVWDIVSSPSTSTHGPQSGIATTTAFPPIATTERDIGEWRLRVTATDNEGPSGNPSGVTSRDVSFRVRNIPPQISFVGEHSIRVGESLHAETTFTADQDQGPLTFRWEVVQAPHSAGVAIHSVLSTSALLNLPTTASHAGTWILKLTVTDNEGPTAIPSGEVSDEFLVLVDADPTANIAVSASGTVVSTNPPTTSAASFPLTLSAASSVDPDSPCPTDPNRCHDTDGRAANVSPGIVGYQWSIIDVPPEEYSRFFTGRVDEVLGISGNTQTLVISSFADMAPGQWTFEVEVFDGEGHSATTSQSVVVLDPNTRPIAVVSPPARYLVDPLTGATTGIALTGTGSFDLDNVLSGTLPTDGVIDYTWHLTPPAGCMPPAPPSGAAAVSFTLFAAGAAVPGACQGIWSIRLEVGDDDMPQLRGSAETTVLIGSCPQRLCIDAPTTLLPERIDFSDRVDVSIYYHLDATVYDEAVFSAGAFVRLDIFHESNPAVPFYSALDPNVLATSRGSFLVFNWNGFGNVLGRPVSGRYNVFLTLVDGAFATTPFTAAQPASIIIAVAEITIGVASDRWTRFEELDIGGAALDFAYTIAGGVTIDRLHWRVRDAATSLLSETDIPVANTGTVTWNGKVGGITLAPANYTFELEAFRLGTSVGRSAPFTFSVYKLNVKPHTGAAPAQGLPVLVNNDDDDMNGTSDATQNPPAGGEDDLVQIDLEMVPRVPGQVTLSADAGAAALTAWPTAAKGMSIALPQTYDASTGALPASVFLEATASGRRELRLEFQPSTGPALPRRALALNLVQIDVVLDSNNNHAVDAADATTLFKRISRWDNAYGVAPGFAVANAADPVNFIEQDPSRFYLRVQDPAGNANPATVETIHLNLGTVTSAAAVFDALADQPLTETGANTGVFVSRSQLLTTDDLPLNADDQFAADSGAGAAVADNIAGDRTHKADIDAFMRFTYQPPGATAALARRFPVCERFLDTRRKVQLRVHVFIEPFQDVGFGMPVVGGGDGTFNFTDTNMNGRHDVGEPSEPYIDLSSGGAIYARGDAMGVADGRGPVVTQAQIDVQIARSTLAWAPACIRFEQLGATALAPAPRVGGIDILDDAVVSIPGDIAQIFADYGGAMTNDVVEVFFAAPLAGANAIAFPPANTAIPHGDTSFVVMAPNLNINFRTLAHELGHILLNKPDALNTQPVFFPAIMTGTDDAINSYRRFTATTETEARTVRPPGMPMSTGNTVTKIP